MPQVAVAVAAWVGNAIFVALGSSAVAATVATAAANFIAAAGFAQGLGAAISAWATIGAVATAAKGKPRIGGTVGTQVDFKADPNAGIPYVMGETGVGGQIVFATTAEVKNQHLLYLTVLSGAGPIEEVVSFSVNDAVTTFSGDNAVGTYHNFMWSRWQLGSQTPAVFDPPATTFLPEWTAAHKLTGYAAHWWVLEYDPKVYPAGTPKPLTIVKGVKVYDPRLDSTYPGGSGSQRSNNEATWAYSENPFLHALTWCIGRFQNGKRLMGVFAAIALIDVAAFVEGANVCDANGWKIGGAVYSTDDKWQVLAAMLAAGGGWPTALGAQISCGVSSPKVSIATMTADDSAGEVTITAAQSRRDRLNGAIPRYRSADHRYEVVPAAKISVSSYVTADDNEDLSRELDFPLCPDVDQAAQLATYAIANSREFGPIVIPAKLKWRGLRPNDCFTINEPGEWGLTSQPVVVLARNRDPSGGAITLTVQSETTGKHAFALGQTGTPPPTPGLTAFDPLSLAAPAAGAFAFAGTTLTSTGASIPALTVTGTSDNAHAEALLVRYRKSGATDWTNWPPVKLTTPGETIRVELTGVTPATVYEAETAYRSARGVVSAYTSEGTASAGTLSIAAYDAAISDGILTPGEKLTVVPGINALISNRTALRARATALGLTTGTSTERAAYETAATNLDNYLATLTTPVAWNVTSGNTTIAVPATFRTRLEDAVKTETDLQSAFAAAEKVLIDSAISDGVLTPAEKRDVIPQINALIAARTALRARADGVNLTTVSSTARANYETAATNLDAYLATLTSPVLWSNSSGNTTISVPATMKTRLEDVRKYQTDLQNACAAIYEGRTQYQDTDGRTYSYLGYLYGFTTGGVAGRGSQPLSTSVGGVAVAAHSIDLPGLSGNVSISIPAHSFTGLSNDTDYVIFYRPQFADWFPIPASGASPYYTSRDGYLWIGNVRTPTGGGTWTQPSSDFSSTGVYAHFECVSTAAYLAGGVRVIDARAGAPLVMLAPHGEALTAGAIERIDFNEADLIRLETKSGAVLTVSTTAPIMVRKGPGYLPRAVRADRVAPGAPVPIFIDGRGLEWDELVACAPAGRGPVGRISAGCGIFAASDAPAGPFILTHNGYSKP